MWYREAKQGSLWQRINPTFEQDIDEAISGAIVAQDFSADNVEKSGGLLKAGKHNIIDLEKFENSFRDIPDNPLSDYKFIYLEDYDIKGGAYCDRTNKIIVIGSNNMQNFGWVRSTIKHEIIHAIEGTIPGLKSELYSHPGESSSKLFKNYIKNQTPLGRKELEDSLYFENFRKLLGDGGDMTEIRKKARELSQRTVRELERRSKSISGDLDLYMANPSELRAFRSEVDNLFSLENLKTVYHQIYENLENGKDLYLKSFYELIQSIVSVSDVSENYQNSFYYNLLHVADVLGFDSRFNLQVIKNLDPGYVRQIAKHLSNLYVEMKSYISSYVPDNSETEVL
jgi:hypothetical protein